MNQKIKTLAVNLRQNGFLKEALFVHRLSDSSNPTIVAFKENVWILDRDPSVEEQRQIQEIAKAVSYPLSMEDDVDTWLTNLSEIRPDILIGTIVDNKISMEGFGDPYLHPRNSVLLKKIVSQLGLDGIVQNTEEGEITHYPGSMRGSELEKSTILYHGTSSRHFEGIMRFGLQPSPEKTNFPKVIHQEHVFLTGNLIKAQFHAIKASTKNSQPVVLEIQIPDISKLGPDYDVDVSAEGGTFKRQVEEKFTVKLPLSRQDADSFPLSREFGIYSYKGRIPSSFIKNVYLAYAENETWYWFDRPYSPQEYLNDLRVAQDMDMLPGPNFSAEDALADIREMARENLEDEIESAGREEEFNNLSIEAQESILDEYARTGEIKF